MVEKYEGIEKIIYDLIEDISALFTKVRDDNIDKYDNNVLLAAALQASLTFTVSSMLAAGISEPTAHEVLNRYYTKLSPDVDKVIKERLNPN